MATLEEKLAIKRASQSSGTGARLSLEQKIAKRQSKTGATQKAPIFSGGTFSDILDVLTIPQYAITGALSGKKTVGEAIKERYSPKEALDVKNPIGGFLVDLVLDPLNFLAPLALGSKGINALKAGIGAKTLGAGAKAGERYLLGLSAPFMQSSIPLIKGERILEGATKLGNYLKKVPGVGSTAKALNFAPASALNDLDSIEETVSSYKDVRRALAGGKGVERMAFAKLANDAMEINKKIVPLISKKKITREELGDILESIANPRSTNVLPEVLRPIADDIREQFQKLNADWERLGGPKLKGKTIKNVLTQEAKDALPSKSFAGSSRVVGGATGSEQFAGYTRMTSLDNSKTALVSSDGPKVATTEAGEKLRKVGENMYVSKGAYKIVERAKLEARVAKGSTAKSVKEAVERAIAGLPSDQVFLREGASPRELNEMFVRQGGKAKFEEDPVKVLLEQSADVAKLVGRENLVTSIREMSISKVVKGGTKVPEGYRKLKIKGVTDIALPVDVADHVEKTVQSFSSISEVQGFLKMYDKIQNTWKGMATFINPAFHTRNAISNMWNMYLAGMVNPIDMVAGNRMEGLVRKAFREGSDDLLKYVPESNKKYVKEFIDDLGLRSSGAFSADIDKDVVKKFMENPFVKGAGAVGEYLENGSKLSLYMYKRRKGFTPKASADEVRKYLFDYGDLSDTEREVFKRVFPFYTWTRNNLPLQIAMLIERPTRISAISKAKEAIDSMTEGEPMEEKYMPEWLKEAYPIYFGKDANGLQKFLKLEGFIPSVDLNKLGRPGEVPLENLTPLIKTPIEMFANYDFFYEKEISEYAGQKVAEPIPFTSKSVPVNAYTSKAIDLVRPFSELQKFSWNPDRTDTPPSKRSQLLNFLIGKTYDLDPSKQKKYLQYRQNEQSADVKSDMKKAKTPEEKARLKELLKKILEGEGISL